jgi:hypothetical protein
MDAALLTAGIAAALAAAGYSSHTPSSRRPSGRQGRRSQSKSVGSNGMQPSKASDLRIRPPSITNVPSRIPRNIASICAWDTVKIDGVITSSTTGIVETNFVFSLSSHPQASSWIALFDQFCVVEASIGFESDMPPGSTFNPPRLYTALDFDNVTNLSSITSLEDFSTCEVINMAPTVRHLRSVRPTIKSSASSTTSATVYRSWMDCGTASSVPHFGIRSIVSQTTSGASVISFTETLVFCFRNQI